MSCQTFHKDLYTKKKYLRAKILVALHNYDKREELRSMNYQNLLHRSIFATRKGHTRYVGGHLQLHRLIDMQGEPIIP